MSKLTRQFYNRNALVVAKELLGKYLIHESEEGKTIGKIVEVEAYIGPDDAASHAYQGLYSSRTRIQYGPGGYSYIYLIYGMYHCFNVVTNKESVPEVVLIRALEPIEGIDIMIQRRKTKKINNLCNGPGKLCMAMGITKHHYGLDLCGNEIYLYNKDLIKDDEIEATTRINIDYAGDAKNYLWRYIIKHNKYVSLFNRALS